LNRVFTRRTEKKDEAQFDDEALEEEGARSRGAEIRILSSATSRIAGF